MTVEDRFIAYATWNGAAWSNSDLLSQAPAGALIPAPEE